MDNNFIFPLFLAIFFSNGSSFRSLVGVFIIEKETKIH